MLEGAAVPSEEEIKAEKKKNRRGSRGVDCESRGATCGRNREYNNNKPNSNSNSNWNTNAQYEEFP